MNLLCSVMKKKCLALIEKKKCTNMHINQNQNFLLTWQDAWKVSKWFWNAFFVYGTVWHWTGPCYFLLKNKPLFNIYNLWDWYFFIIKTVFETVAWYISLHYLLCSCLQTLLKKTRNVYREVEQWTKEHGIMPFFLSFRLHSPVIIWKIRQSCSNYIQKKEYKETVLMSTERYLYKIVMHFMKNIFEV